MNSHPTRRASPLLPLLGLLALIGFGIVLSRLPQSLRDTTAPALHPLASLTQLPAQGQIATGTSDYQSTKLAFLTQEVEAQDAAQLTPAPPANDSAFALSTPTLAPEQSTPQPTLARTPAGAGVIYDNLPWPDQAVGVNAGFTDVHITTAWFEKLRVLALSVVDNSGGAGRRVCERRKQRPPPIDRQRATG